MNISSLEKMEEIVDRHSNLNWNGWDIIERKADNAAWTKPNAIFLNGKWYRTNTYKLSENGWNIPDRLTKRNG